MIKEVRQRMTTLNIYELFDKVEKQEAMIKTLINEKISLESRLNKMGGEDLGQNDEIV